MGSDRTALAVLLKSDVLVTAVLPEEGESSQSLPLRTHKVVSVVGKAHPGNHAVVLVGMDGHVGGDAQVLQLLSEGPALYPVSAARVSGLSGS